MRFVHGQHRQLQPPQRLKEPLVGQALGRDVQELEPPRVQVAVHLPAFFQPHAGIHPSRGHAAADQEIDLVLHQRDQRRDDQRQAVQQQGRQLVAEALAGPGREDRQHRPPGQQCRHDPLLPFAEGGEAEDGPERVGGGGGGRFSR